MPPEPPRTIQPSDPPEQLNPPKPVPPSRITCPAFREHYQAGATIFWTMPLESRATGWLSPAFHTVFREMMLHAAAREGLLCPAYCLMPDHLHLVWMGLRASTDQRNAIKFLRASLAPHLLPAKFQHQAHDHALSREERQRQQFSVACTDYGLRNPLRAGLASQPSEWPYTGAIVPGYPKADPFSEKYWPWFWDRYLKSKDPRIDEIKLPPRTMA